MTEEENILFVEVILTLHLPNTYCYRVPRVLNKDVKIGQRVAVQFGKKKIYSAIIVKVTDEVPKTSNLKYILDIIDSEPVLTQKQIEFYNWIASYYVAYIGDVLSAALPSAFRLKSETTVEISPAFQGDVSCLDDTEKQIVDYVAKKTKVNVSELETVCPQKQLISVVSSLIKKDILVTDEELKKQYVQKKETIIYLSEEYYKDEDKKRQLFSLMDSNKKYSSQNNVLLTYLTLLHGRTFVRKSELLDKQCSPSSINTLIRNGILIKEDVEISRLRELKSSKSVEEIILNEEQATAYNKILERFASEPSVSLLNGVTGSGKTEVYIKLIEYVLQKGGQVLYLIPEIAITSQLVQRLEQFFGNRIGVYNSRYSTMERAEVWYRTKTEDKERRFDVILGSRSAVFLPFTDLQLVIADEEHDTSYKQTEPVPHYHGRDAALYLAKLFKAHTVLGSATPSLESFYYAQQGKYQLLNLLHRYSNILLPEIFVADVKESMKQREMYGIFTKTLYDEINICLEKGKQIILFQNRRGFAPRVKCNICGYEPKCPNCDVSLVLHKHSHSLTCHYCGYTTDVLSSCPDCGSHSLRIVGIGTEKIEEEIASYFPKARVARMDLDSTRTKEAFTKIIEDFANKKTDILAGTQIVTKGLDFDNVGLVGVVDADALLHYPDFRAFERAFQILTQVSGRAGRRNQRGKVVIQTFDPYNQVIRDVCEHNYQGMYESQIMERKVFYFPPFCRLIKITLQHRDRIFLQKKAVDYACSLREIFGKRMFGPQEPVIARIRNLYHQVIWLKIEKKLPYKTAKRHLMEMNEEYLASKDNSSIRIYIDVDPI